MFLKLDGLNYVYDNCNFVYILVKLLIVEDSERLQRSISAGLRRIGIAVDQAFDGRQGLAFIETNDYEVIVLDLMLPGMDGISILKTIRRQGNETHVLILSAKSQTEDRIAGLNFGADDYLVKPFMFDELLARIRALARRKYSNKNPLIKINGLEINTAACQVRYKNREIELTPTEYSILEYLGRRKGRVLSHDQMIFMIYDSLTEATKNTIEAHISTLRKKLRELGLTKIIQTRRGFGYIIE